MSGLLYKDNGNLIDLQNLLHREHVTLEIIENKKKYKHLYLLAPSNLHYPKLRIELDTLKDFSL